MTETLDKYGVEFIPEAHCYLKESGVRKDFTRPGINFKIIADTLLDECEILPKQTRNL